MIGLQGRPEASPTVDEVRELTLEEVRGTARAKQPARITALRDSHHAAARLTAMGLRTAEIAQQVGYSYHGLYMLQQDPAFAELVAHYREVLTDQWTESVDEYFQTLVGVRTKALRLISDQLDTAKPGEIPLNQLHVLHSDSADRTGYPKRKETVNLNLDFADKLDAAVRRSREVRQIEAKALPATDSGGSALREASGSQASLNPLPETGPPAAPVAGVSGGSASDGAERGAGTPSSEQRTAPRPQFPRELLPQPAYFPLRRRA